MNRAGVPDAALTRRIEEASLNAWPAMQQLLMDGWLLRFSRGFTKRANSVVPLYPSIGGGHEPLAERVRRCENLYAREGLQTIFRLPAIDDLSALDAHLESRGYHLVDPTLVLAAPTQPGPAQDGFALVPAERWLDIYAELTGMPAAARKLHGAIIAGIPTPCGFAVLRRGERPVACGLAVVERDLLGLFDIVTHPDARRAGHGTALVGSLLGWGHASGARLAYLQMIESNTPASALYRKLGFEILYNYWYRISP
jgi:ribosomal protein S18 acetylase RimI-like enzyme